MVILPKHSSVKIINCNNIIIIYKIEVGLLKNYLLISSIIICKKCWWTMYIYINVDNIGTLKYEW